MLYFVELKTRPETEASFYLFKDLFVLCFFLKWKVKKERQKTFRGSNINWPRRKFQTHSILARYFVICLLFIQWTCENSEKKLRSNCAGMNFHVSGSNMHACYLYTAIDIVANDFPLLKGTLITNEKDSDWTVLSESQLTVSMLLHSRIIRLISLYICACIRLNGTERNT